MSSNNSSSSVFGVRFRSSLPGRCRSTFFSGLISLLTFTPAIANLLSSRGMKTIFAVQAFQRFLA